MPQMMPLNWLLQFIFFITIYFMINSFIYFNFIQKINSYKNLYSLKISWKW
uniref:ATP synthase F0 subunit 8 n=1 Tax=Cucujoidea sp. 10 KM-2017 TaxID=2219346 RepID=A0A346RJR4_9CUCU|nr:ATP synthase F0 subunit 8 [Cucujoidea sp. 10 KM-2017]